MVLPEIPDGLASETKNALAIRNAASASGVCPDCGAVAAVHADPEFPRVYHAVFEHEPGCAALTDGGAA